jgi:rsbT co-antagonist protein RsbR
VIRDVSGVDEFDEATARHLLSAARAASQIGARMVLSGISPTMARAMVTLAAPLGGLSTFRSLEDALRHVLAALGYRIARAAPA